MYTPALVLVAFAYIASAAPSINPGPATPSGVPQVAKFDDLKVIPAAPELNAIGQYQGLKWTSLVSAKLGINKNILTGVVPESGFNVAGYTIPGIVLTGSGAVLTPVDYETFSLSSLFFACIVDSASDATSVPVPCKISFRGFLPGNDEKSVVITKTFSSVAGQRQNMASATFKDLNKMAKIEIGFESVDGSILGGVVALGTVLLLDNVVYTLY